MGFLWADGPMSSTLDPGEYVVALEIGSLFNSRYKVIKGLGAGGMGEVYLVEDTTLNNQQLALKLLSSKVSSEPQKVERFKREVCLASKLSHKNIVKVFDLETDENGLLYITMEYVAGKSLGDRLREGEEFAFSEVLNILLFVASALSYAHAEGVIHRDVKPDNIMFTPEGEVKLTDFGVARSTVDERGLTETGEIVGTIFYMSPEQFTKSQADGRTDIYSLGIVAFELVTGERPYNASNYVTIYQKHFSEPMPAISEYVDGVPNWYQQFVERCCAKSAGGRYQGMEEVVAAIAKELRRMGIFISASLVSQHGIIHGLKSLASFQIRRLRHVLEKMWLRTKPIYKSGLFSLIPAMFYVVCTLPSIGLNQRINHLAMDWWFQMRGPANVPKKVIVVAIDDKSYAELGLSSLKPWPRNMQARLLERLALFGAKTAIIDFVFKEKGNEIEDERLANAMSLLPTFIGRNLVTTSRLGENGLMERSVEWRKPDERFIKAASGVFSVEIRAIGGIVRQFAFDGNLRQIFPPLAPAIFGKKLEKAKLPEPTDYINFRGPSGAMKSVSFSDALTGDDAVMNQFIDAIVLIGFKRSLPNDTVVPDTFPTPYGGKTAGVEIHAAVVSNLIDKDWIRGIPWKWELIGGWWFAFMLSYLVISLSVGKALVATLLLGIVLPIIHWVALSLGYFLPCCALVLVVAFAMGIRVVMNVRERLFVRMVMGR